MQLLPFQWDLCKINWHQHCSWSGKSAFPRQEYYKQGNKAEKKGDGDDCCALLRRSQSPGSTEKLLVFFYIVYQSWGPVFFLTVVLEFWIEQDNNFLFLKLIFPVIIPILNVPWRMRRHAQRWLIVNFKSPREKNRRFLHLRVIWQLHPQNKQLQKAAASCCPSWQVWTLSK